ncbi:MAG: hypothetical protein M3R55_08545, partial [Acidobacteriota bacterium]|nr:hypothetical protein [Acidobacteriota bacterium]
AGLRFAILTDHGDGTREPAPPEYLHGVLLLDGVEVTTSAGHYAAFGLSRAPYPLGGPPYAVAEDVARLGGFGVAAHGDSVKPDLRWRDWTAPVDGVEWINGDSAWRDESTPRLARALVNYLFRPAAALATLADRPGRLLQRTDEIARARTVVGLAGADAHARLPLSGDDEPHRSGWTLPAPAYVQSFRAFTNVVDVGAAPTGDAAADAAALMGAVRRGRVTAAMPAVATPADLRFSAQSDGGQTWHVGDRVPTQALSFHVQASEVIGSSASLVRLELRRDGRVMAHAEGSTLTHAVPAEAAPGVWRVEVTLADRPGLPWMLSNAIVVGGSRAALPAAAGAGLPPAPEAVFELTAGEWGVEKDPSSEGAVVPGANQLALTYRLGRGAPSGQFVAASRAIVSADAWGDIIIRARASAPTRVWIQLRLSDIATGQRWGRSIYLDVTSRELRLPISTFAPLEPSAPTRRPNVVQVRAVLIVVDTVNSRPGGEGRITLEQLSLERHAASTPAPGAPRLGRGPS